MVEAYGQQEADGISDILLTGSTEYYLKRSTGGDGEKSMS